MRYGILVVNEVPPASSIPMSMSPAVLTPLAPTELMLMRIPQTSSVTLAPERTDAQDPIVLTDPDAVTVVPNAATGREVMDSTPHLKSCPEGTQSIATPRGSRLRR